MKAMTKTSELPFSSYDVIMNISNYKLSLEETNLLKYGLSFCILPERISRSDIFTTFEMINRFVTTQLKSSDYAGN